MYNDIMVYSRDCGLDYLSLDYLADKAMIKYGQTVQFNRFVDGEDKMKSSFLCDLLLFSGSCSYSYAAKAFIFSLYNTNGYDPVKLTQYQYINKAMYSCSNYGPTFGGNLGQHDIYTPNDAVNQLTAFTYCGSTYSLPQGYSVGHCAFFAGGSHFTPTDIEVFYEITS